MADEKNLTENPESNPSSTKTTRREFLQAGAVGGVGLLGLTQNYERLSEEHADLQAKHQKLVQQMGDEIAPFPKSGTDGFLSHFIISIELLKGDLAGKILTLSMPPAAQTVSRSEPFIYKGPSAKHRVQLPIPKNCTLSNTIVDDDFLNRPAEFFEEGKEVVWMQILNLDSKTDTDFGTIRIILGETLKREYPDIFKPSLGAALSLSDGGFPARLFFNPYAIIETPFGAFRAIHGTLAYGRTVAFPPISTPISICNCIPLESIEAVRKGLTEETPFARIIALSHPIDVSMQISGDEAFECVEKCISGARLM
jgi:hypothetical protein